MIAKRWRPSWRRLCPEFQVQVLLLALEPLLRSPQSVSGPSLVTQRRPAAQTVGYHLRRLVAVSGAQTGNDQRVLPQLTLDMAAADPHNRGHQRLEDADRGVIIALGECLDAATKADRGRTGGEFAVGLTRFHLRQPGFQNLSARCRCDQGAVDIGK